MKRLTYTVTLHVEDGDLASYSSPERLADAACTYGDKHQDWYFDQVKGPVTVEDEADE